MPRYPRLTELTLANITLFGALALFLVVPIGTSASAAVFEARIAASADDAEELPGVAPNLTSSDLELTQDGGSQTVGMRWTNVTIPQGATITSAWIQFTSKEDRSGVISLTIQGEASDNAAAFAAVIGNISSRARTGSSVPWVPSNPWTIDQTGPDQKTPDIAPLVRDIVGRSGWASGRPLAIIITGTGRRTAYAFNGSAAQAPLLHIEYSTSPPVEAPPIAHLSVSQIAPLTVRANASASTDIDLTPIASYEFDFGDGTVVTTTAPTAVADHTYAAAGPYTVSVIVTDTANLPSSPATAGINVTGSSSGTIDRRVAAANDDAEQNSTATDVNSSDLELILDSSTPQTVGIRWTSLAIPVGATITNAYVQFSSKENQSTATSLVIKGEKIGSALAFTSAAGNISSRPQTTQSVNWPSIQPWLAGETGSLQQTPDLSSVIQEIVNGSGWASGNALALIITGSGRRTAWAFNGNASLAPLLHVEFFVGPPPPNAPPVARLSLSQLATPPLTIVADGTLSTDTDLQRIATYRFDFGDGAVVTTNAPEATAQHTYSDVGNHTVMLVCTDAGGLASDPVSQTILVNPPPDDPPVPALVVTQVASPALTVLADASGSTDNSGTPIATYTFNFNDGSGPQTGPSPTLTHTYASTGTKTVSVIVTDAGGHASASLSRTISVSSGFAASLEKRVIASNDDAEQPPSGSVGVSSSDLELVDDSGTNQVVGIRWTGITIPRLAQITNAYVQFSSKESQAGTIDIVIRGQHGNAATFSSTAGGISARPQTTALVHWAPPSWASTGIGPEQRTVNLTPVIQEIVNGSGWASGNALALIFSGSLGVRRTAWSFDGRPTEAPLLHIDYVTNTPPVDDPPVARLTVTQLGTPALTVQADASASTDTDQTPISTYRFDWGDGTSATTVAAPNATATHTYASAGTRTVSVLVTDTAGKTNTASQSINVQTGTSGGGSVAVYVGYYDTHHTSRLKPKPSPWRGASNVTFVGTADPGTSDGWDTSCVRIDNLGTTSLSNVLVTVNIGSKSFGLWSAQTIAAGRTLILAQTGFENFDGSDTSPAGCYGCNPNLCLTQVVSTKPVVHVRIGTQTVDYIDTGQIMNTKGADGAGCPATGTRNDESSNWVRIFPAGAAANMAPDAEGGYRDPWNVPGTTPRTLELLAPSPNPSQGDLQIGFSLPQRGKVTLAVYDVMGRKVKDFLDEVLEPGDYRGEILLTDTKAGMYFLRMTTPQGSQHRQFVLVQ